METKQTDDESLADVVARLHVPARERLAAILAHLAAGGRVMVATYTRATIYDQRHADMFTATDRDLWVQSGRRRVCLNFTPTLFVE